MAQLGAAAPCREVREAPDAGLLHSRHQVLHEDLLEVVLAELPRTERAEHCVVPTYGALQRVSVSRLSLHDGQTLVPFGECVRIPRERRHIVARSQQESHRDPSGPARCSDDQDLHAFAPCPAIT